MKRLTRDGMIGPVSREIKFSGVNGDSFLFPLCSADHNDKVIGDRSSASAHLSLIGDDHHSNNKAPQTEPEDAIYTHIYIPPKVSSRHSQLAKCQHPPSFHPSSLGFTLSEFETIILRKQSRSGTRSIMHATYMVIRVQLDSDELSRKKYRFHLELSLQTQGSPAPEPTFAPLIFLLVPKTIFGY